MLKKMLVHKRLMNCCSSDTLFKYPRRSLMTVTVSIFTIVLGTKVMECNMVFCFEQQLFNINKRLRHADINFVYSLFRVTEVYK